MPSTIHNSPPGRPDPTKRDHPLTSLPREDLDLICELVLQSGSLKGLASAYGVSYPTIRNRLDRTIARLRDIVEGRATDPLTDLLATLVERGELTTRAAREIQQAARQAPKDTRDASP
jgi:hypothetical protein